MPNLILFNGKIHAHPTASAIAIRDGKIFAVGDDAEIRTLAHSRTEQINLNGKLILPGFTDAHFHFFDWALGRLDVQVAGVSSLMELQQRVAARAEKTPAGQWIKGSGWNESEWTPPEMPTRTDLDVVSPNHPVILWRADHHAAVANSRALAIAGITADFPDPPDGVIERDLHGEPTGVLKELAINLVSDHIPPADDDTALDALRSGIAELHRLGITGLHDQRMMSGSRGAKAWRAYQTLERQGVLNLRVTSNIHYSQLPEAIALGLKSGFGSDRLRFGFVKMFSDGSMGAHTAWMLARYEDTKDGYGLAAMPMEKIAAVTREANAHGWAISVHAIGDRANREVLDILEEVTAAAPAPSSIPHRIEHAQLLHPDDLPRFAKLNITASMQPVHLLDDMVKMERVWGPRARCAFAFKCLLKSGARLAFGSDAPVANPNPWLGIHAAVNRSKPKATDGGYYPEEQISVAQAVHAYTQANADAVGLSAVQGSISPGKWADLVVASQNIFAVDPLNIADTTAVMTIFNGEIVFSA